MTVRKANNGYDVVHCHGKSKGKPINKKPMTKKKAVKMHKAIEANKKSG